MKLEANGPLSSYMTAKQQDLAAELGGDANAQVAAMLLRQAREKTECTIEMRHTQRDRMEAHHEARIKAMLDKAECNYTAATHEATGKMIQGGVNVVTNGIQLSRELSTNTKANTPCKSDLGDKHKLTTHDLNRNQLRRKPADIDTLVAGCRIADGAAQFASGTLDWQAARDRKKAGKLEATAVNHEHAIDNAKQILDDLRDEQQDLNKLTKTAIDFLRDAQSAKEQADRAAVHR